MNNYVLIFHARIDFGYHNDG